MRTTRVVYSALAVATATLLVALLSWAVGGVRADPPGPYLARIGEEMVWMAGEAPLSHAADLGATAATVTGENGALLIPDEGAVLPGIELRKTVGLDPSICATTDEISTGPGTDVTYCFEVTNTGATTFTQHDLVDSHLGVILDGLAFNLLSGHSVFLTQTAIITETLVNTATWTAYADGFGYAVAATDAATVTVVAPSISFTKTVGLDASVCAVTDAITVPENTAVTYCFEVTNTGATTFTQHDLVDSHLGVILDGFAFNLLPGNSVFLTQTAIITETLVNTATWTVYNLGPTDVVSAMDVATVTVEMEDLEIYLPFVIRQ
jgi:hypothetical protein